MVAFLSSSLHHLLCFNIKLVHAGLAHDGLQLSIFLQGLVVGLQNVLLDLPQPSRK